MARAKAGTEGALLRGILAHPDEDTARLVYADWLDENDRAAHAEFIRVQCALARIAGDDPQRFALAERENELLEHHREEFVAGVSQAVRKAFRWTFRRGFIDEVETTATYFVKSAQGLFARHPVRVAELRYIDAPALAAFAGLSRLSGLSTFGLSAAGLEVLLASPHLTSLKELRGYWPHDCTPARFLQLLDAPACAGLTHFTACGLPSEALGLFASSPRFAPLTEFGFVGGFAASDVRALASSPLASNLTALTLYNHNQTGAGLLPALAASPHLGKLRNLTVDTGNLPEEDVEAFADSPHLGNLTDLSLGWAALTKSGWEKLLRSPRLPRLTRVHVHGWDYTVPVALGLRKLKTNAGIMWVWVPR